MTTEIVGPIVTGGSVRRAVEAAIKDRMSVYLDALAEQNGRRAGEFPLFRSYASSIALDKFTEDQIPTCVISAPGLTEAPRKERESYTTKWAIGVGAIVSGQDRENTFELAEIYAAAIRGLIMQQPSLNGFAAGVVWLGERFDELLGPEDLRTIAAGTLQFEVEVRDTLRTDYGARITVHETSNPVQPKE